MDSIESLGLNETIVPANTHNDLLMIGCVHPQPGPEYFCGDCPFEGAIYGTYRGLLINLNYN